MNVLIYTLFKFCMLVVIHVINRLPAFTLSVTSKVFITVALVMSTINTDFSKLIIWSCSLWDALARSITFGIFPCSGYQLGCWLAAAFQRPRPCRNLFTPT